MRFEVIRKDPEESRPFEELNHSAVVGCFTQCYPGFETRYGSGWEGMFGPDDLFDEGIND